MGGGRSKQPQLAYGQQQGVSYHVLPPPPPPAAAPLPFQGFGAPGPFPGFAPALPPQQFPGAGFAFPPQPGLGFPGF